MGQDHTLAVGYGVPNEKLFKEELRTSIRKEYDRLTGEAKEVEHKQWLHVRYDGKESDAGYPGDLFDCEDDRIQFGFLHAVVPINQDSGRTYNDLQADVPDLPLSPNEEHVAKMVAAGIPLEVAREARLMAIVTFYG